MKVAAGWIKAPAILISKICRSGLLPTCGLANGGDRSGRVEPPLAVVLSVHFEYEIPYDAQKQLRGSRGVGTEKYTLYL